MALTVDLSQATLDEMRAFQDTMIAEIQKKDRDNALLDQAHALVAEAKKQGHTKAQVSAALTKVVNTYYA